MPQAAAEMARRLALILSAVAALIARRFLRDPKFAAVIVPLWGWLGRSARRFERAVTRPIMPRPVEARTAQVPPVRVRVRVRLPGGQGWLVKALGWEAAGYGCQLTALLADPEMQAVLAAVPAVPAVGRILRPVCRMLGVVPVGVMPAGDEAAVRRVRSSRPPKVRMPRFSWKRAWAEVENRPWPTVGPDLVRPRPR